MIRTNVFGILLFCLLVQSQFSVSAGNNSSRKKLDLDIVFIGNSITYGANLANAAQDAPPVVASELLRKKAGIQSVSFSNQGRSGFTTVNYLPSSPTFAELVQATRALHTNPEHMLIFSIKLGTNDSAIQGPLGAPVSKEAYGKNMKAIVDELLQQFPDAKIVLQQPIWYSPNTYNGAKYLAEGLARLESYVPELKSLVKSYAEMNKNHVFMGDDLGFEYFRKNYLTDCVAEKGQQGTFYLHPNEKGSAVLAEFWAKAIYKIVK